MRLLKRAMGQGWNSIHYQQSFGLGCVHEHSGKVSLKLIAGRVSEVLRLHTIGLGKRPDHERGMQNLERCFEAPLCKSRTDLFKATPP